MLMTFLNWLTLMSYAALNIDIILETRRIHRTRSSNDLSIIGMAIRFIVVFIILAKFASIGDRLLIAGQGVIAVTFSVYFALAFYYIRHGRKKRK